MAGARGFEAQRRVGEGEWPNGVSEELPEEHKTCIYRIVQEALHNSVQHAEARRIVVTVKQEAQRLRVTIEDDGKGFDPRGRKGWDCWASRSA